MGLRARPRLSALVLALTLLVAGCGSSGGHARSSTSRTHAPARTSATTVTATSSPTSGPASSAAAFAHAQATIVDTAHETRIPHSFLGFSTEYWTLPIDELHTRLYRRILGMLHVPGDGRFILRIGGDSSDHAVWDPTAARLPPWAFAVTPALVRRTAGIVDRMRMRVIIDINTITSTPRLAAQWARAIQQRLPRGSLIGFEIGNEPDLYRHAEWVSELKHTGFDLAKLPAAITPASYVTSYGHFAHSVLAADPGKPLLAPALANPVSDLQWVGVLLDSPHPGLRTVSIHRYPYSACARPGQPNYPTVERLLSERATVGMASSVTKAVRMSHRQGFPVRVTEFNSVTCGGVRGVSNTFATALWAPDALFQLLRTGIVGANLHVRVDSINAPFYFTSHGIVARPLLYGLDFFKRMLGPHSRLVPVKVDAPSSPGLKLWAVRVGRERLNVLLIDKGKRPVSVDLRLPASAPATITRLLAPSAASTTGVTLGGQHLTDQVTWTGKRHTETVAKTDGHYTVTLPRQSAAILSLRVAPSTLAR